MGIWGHRRAVVLVIVLLLAGAAGATANALRASAGEPTTPAPAAAAEQPAASARGDSASVTLTAVVPAETFVHLDGHGRPYEAMTNSGARPSPGDHFFVERDGAATGPVANATIADVLDRAPQGDWSQAGRWHALS